MLKVVVRIESLSFTNVVNEKELTP